MYNLFLNWYLYNVKLYIVCSRLLKSLFDALVKYRCCRYPRKALNSSFANKYQSSPMFINFYKYQIVRTVRCSLPPSCPIPYTYSTTVLHPSKMVFCEAALPCNIYCSFSLGYNLLLSCLVLRCEHVEWKSFLFEPV